MDIKFLLGLVGYERVEQMRSVVTFLTWAFDSQRIYAYITEPLFCAVGTV